MEGFMGIDPTRRMQMAQALAGGNDQWAPIRQALMARRMQSPTEQMVSPGTAANGGWQTSVQNKNPQGLGGLFSQGSQGGLLAMLGRILNGGGNQSPAPAAAPASPFVRDMASVRTRQMADALSRPVSAGPVSNAANVTGNASPFRLFGIGM